MYRTFSLTVHESMSISVVLGLWSSFDDELDRLRDEAMSSGIVWAITGGTPPSIVSVTLSSSMMTVIFGFRFFIIWPSTGRFPTLHVPTS